MYKFLLFPFGVLYFLVTYIRNKLYDFNVFKSVSFKIPLIGVGNLSTGGTGKTPMVEYLIRNLSKKKIKRHCQSRFQDICEFRYSFQEILLMWIKAKQETKKN